MDNGFFMEASHLKVLEISKLEPGRLDENFNFAYPITRVGTLGGTPIILIGMSCISETQRSIP